MQNKNLLIYVVDKSAGYRRIIAESLQEQGLCNYRLFDSGELCITSDLPKADLVILDYNLGEGAWNGIEFMEEYERFSKDSSFLFLSSNSKMEIAVESIKMGALDYILKSKPGLVRLIKQVDKVSSGLN